MSDKLTKIRNKARRLGITGFIEESPRLQKKYRITRPNGQVIDFGDSGFEDWWDHRDPIRRASYLKRAKGIRSQITGCLTANDKSSANYYAIRLLW